MLLWKITEHIISKKKYVMIALEVKNDIMSINNKCFQNFEIYFTVKFQKNTF